MKRTLAVIFILVMVLCGCSEKRKITPQVKNISFVAQITRYNEKISLETTVDSKGNMKAIVLKPDDFKGLQFNFQGDKVTAQFLGLTYTPKTGELSVNHAAKIIYDAFRDAEKHSKISVKDGENCEIEGDTEDMPYILKFSPAGLPLSLELENDDFKAVFSELRVLSK